jgi:hypothetical protein
MRVDDHMLTPQEREWKRWSEQRQAKLGKRPDAVHAAVGDQASTPMTERVAVPVVPF